MKSLADGIELSCDTEIKKDNREAKPGPLKLPYKDSNTGEYACGENDDSKIFVKFRSKF